MGTNGSKPIPFSLPPAAVPIIGQPFAIEGWFLTLVVTCRCERTGVVLLAGVPGTAAGQCKGCGKVLVLQGVSINAQGHMQFSLAAAPPASAVAEP